MELWNAKVNDWTWEETRILAYPSVLSQILQISTCSEPFPAELKETDTEWFRKMQYCYTGGSEDGGQVAGTKKCDVLWKADSYSPLKQLPPQWHCGLSTMKQMLKVLINQTECVCFVLSHILQ